MTDFLTNAGYFTHHTVGTARKPSPATAMRQLIAEARVRLPFDRAGASCCDGDCSRCAIRLLATVEDQLVSWTARLDAGEQPSLGELAALGRLCRDVARATADQGQTSGC